ncbi:MAG: pantetheine-phosphate adenylyltransferase [Erysipelothrix sp.]|nr:pantetheine-phosphate adenylyltransferase [Erysipelothrix sp.]
MKTAVYAGTFDPPTYGHLDIIKRASAVFDVLIVAIMRNSEKNSVFNTEEKVAMLETICKDFDNVKILVGDGLTVDLARENNADFLVRGIRAIMDYEYELQIASANMVIGKDIETVFFLARPEHSYLSSSIVRSIAEHSGDISKFIPESIIDIVNNKFQSSKSK